MSSGFSLTIQSSIENIKLFLISICRVQVNKNGEWVIGYADRLNKVEKCYI
jgi:hypothetical protein